MFLETCKNTDLHTVSLDFTLEHIWPQNKDNLENIKLIDNINLTLLEGKKRSEESHRGNSSYGSNDYKEKIEHYKE